MAGTAVCEPPCADLVDSGYSATNNEGEARLPHATGNKCLLGNASEMGAVLNALSRTNGERKQNPLPATASLHFEGELCASARCGGPKTTRQCINVGLFPTRERTLLFWLEEARLNMEVACCVAVPHRWQRNRPFRSLSGRTSVLSPMSGLPTS